MNAPAGARRLSAYCQLYNDDPDNTPADIHGLCKGPGEVRAKPVPPATRGTLIMTIRCDCDCHDTQPGEVGVMDAT
ncbi:hypothetical protein ACI2L4_37230 [Streptomyces sparsogenes]|uniref:hypothetical protein n=1 Tax=Streptomyces sparsogenes TaxID=67365 RepID=UPI0038509FC6